MRKTAALVTLAMLLLGPVAIWAQKDSPPAKESAPDVPDAIAVPSGLEPVLFAHAKGSQIYACQQGAGKHFEWTLKGPEGELKDRKDKVIGQHTAGPTWKLKDGSEVTGKPAAQVDSLDSEPIPWWGSEFLPTPGRGGLAMVPRIQAWPPLAGSPVKTFATGHHKVP